jgi:hypothetical protein
MPGIEADLDSTGAISGILVQHGIYLGDFPTNFDAERATKYAPQLLPSNIVLGFKSQQSRPYIVRCEGMDKRGGVL